MLGCPTDITSIERGVALHGAAPNSAAMLTAEVTAARESISTELYIIWSPMPHCQLPSTASDEIRNGTGQCCRIGSRSICMCGHALQSHYAVSLPKNKHAYIKPPQCTDCKYCKGFNYAPSLPEECGQWWLARRKDFNIFDWRERVRRVPSEYACIGCDVSVAEHETIFETRVSRLTRGAKVDDDYIPLSDMVNIRERALMGQGGSSSRNQQPMQPVNNPIRRQRYQPLGSDPVATAVDMISSKKANIDITAPLQNVKHTSPSDVVVMKKTAADRKK